jgi:choline/ethanolamine kinase
MEDQATFDGYDDVKYHLMSWKKLENNQIKCERMGGLSNEIWKLTALEENIHPQVIIYRKFGTGIAIVDRDRENYILEGLAKKKIAPKCYGGDKEHRIEKFYEGKELSPSDLNEKPIQRHLAKLLADLHSVEFDKLDKTPSVLKIFRDRAFINSFEEKAKRDVYTPVERKLLNEIISLTKEEEISFLRGIVPKKKESVSFSHNDLHSQNVIVQSKSNRYSLIDFEYSDYNYRGYDIANLFNECMFEYDAPEPPHYTLDESKFPKDRDLIDFIKYYLFFSRFKEGYDVDVCVENDSFRDEYIKQHYNLDTFNEEVEEIVGEVKICTLLSHYFWILWAVVKSKDGDFEFDYIHYAYKRFELYEKLRRTFSDIISSQTSMETLE